MLFAFCRATCCALLVAVQVSKIRRGSEWPLKARCGSQNTELELAPEAPEGCGLRSFPFGFRI
eukprot:3624756-Alexandrium_andersonii.AAC.1